MPKACGELFHDRPGRLWWLSWIATVLVWIDCLCMA